MENPYQLVLVELILVVEQPHLPSEERPKSVGGLQATLDRNDQHWLRHGGDPEGINLDQEAHWPHALGVRGAEPVPEDTNPPSYYSSSQILPLKFFISILV